MIPDAGADPVQDEDPVGAQRGADPVGDDDQHARPGRERALGPGRRARIQMAGRLVEYGQPGWWQMGLGQRDELAFPGGQSRRAQPRIVSAEPGHQGAQAGRVDGGVEFGRPRFRRQVACEE